MGDADPPSSDTLRGIVAGEPVSAPPSPPRADDDIADVFKHEFNKRLIARGLKLIATGRNEARLQYDDIDCVWRLKSVGLAYQLRYLGAEAVGEDDSRSVVLRGSPVSEPFVAMNEMQEIATLLAAAVVREREAIPSRVEAHRQHTEALAKWNREKADAEARGAATMRALRDAERAANQKIAAEAARQAREKTLLDKNRRDATELTELLPKGWTAVPTDLASQGNLVLRSRSIPPALVRELVAVLPAVDRDSGYAELRTFLAQVRKWRERDEKDRHAALYADLDRVCDEIEREKEQRRLRESSLLGRAMRLLGLELGPGAGFRRRQSRQTGNGPVYNGLE